MDPLSWGTPLWITVAALFVIVLARAGGTYLLGRAMASGLQRTSVSRLMATRGYLAARERLDRWGAPAVALSFLTIGVQTLVNLAAGAGRMSARSYVPALIVGSTMWALLYGIVGTAGVGAWLTLYHRSPFWAIVFAVALVVGLAALLLRRRKVSEPSNAA